MYSTALYIDTKNSKEHPPPPTSCALLIQLHEKYSTDLMPGRARPTTQRLPSEKISAPPQSRSSLPTTLQSTTRPASKTACSENGPLPDKSDNPCCFLAGHGGTPGTTTVYGICGFTLRFQRLLWPCQRSQGTRQTPKISGRQQNHLTLAREGQQFICWQKKHESPPPPPGA